MMLLPKLQPKLQPPLELSLTRRHAMSAMLRSLGGFVLVAAAFVVASAHRVDCAVALPRAIDAELPHPRRRCTVGDGGDVGDVQ